MGWDGNGGVVVIGQVFWQRVAPTGEGLGRYNRISPFSRVNELSHGKLLRTAVALLYNSESWSHLLTMELGEKQATFCCGWDEVKHQTNGLVTVDVLLLAFQIDHLRAHVSCLELSSRPSMYINLEHFTATLGNSCVELRFTLDHDHLNARAFFLGTLATVCNLDFQPFLDRFPMPSDPISLSEPIFTSLPFRTPEESFPCESSTSPA